MALFSERYGYVKPRNILVRECINIDIQNAICSAFDYLYRIYNRIDTNVGRGYEDSYKAMEMAIWIHFQNMRRNDFYTHTGHRVVATTFLESNVIWYKKLDMLEFAIKWMFENYNDNARQDALKTFVQYLNERFQILGFAYRIVNNQIVEITSEEEIVEIEEALKVSDPIAEHLSTSMALLSQRPNPDYRNSIKESISAVEYICREITGKTTLGDALKELDKKGLQLSNMLKTAFEKLYVYTNDKATGIRHALMDEKDAPSFDEAKFMLVACSAFVNYINAKNKVK